MTLMTMVFHSSGNIVQSAVVYWPFTHNHSSKQGGAIVRFASVTTQIMVAAYLLLEDLLSRHLSIHQALHKSIHQSAGM